jgi:hypothetical protein
MSACASALRAPKMEICLRPVKNFVPRSARSATVSAENLIFLKVIAAKKRWYWALSSTPDNLSSRLAHANKTNKKLELKG